MISPETHAQIRHYFYAEHWKIGTIANELGLHADTVRSAIETERFRGTRPLRPSVVDPWLGFIRQILDQHPRLRATRIYQMVRDRGYTGSVVQLRRAIANLRPSDAEEEVYRNEYRDFQEARASIREFLERVYNEKRLYSALGYVPPTESAGVRLPARSRPSVRSAWVRIGPRSPRLRRLCHFPYCISKAASPSA